MNSLDPLHQYELSQTRRQLFGKAALGLGTASLAHLLGNDLGAEEAAKASPDGMHHKAKAKRVIYLFMSGGPSHHDMWDYKPKMREMLGEDLPDDPSRHRHHREGASDAA